MDNVMDNESLLSGAELQRSQDARPTALGGPGPAAAFLNAEPSALLDEMEPLQDGEDNVAFPSDANGEEQLCRRRDGSQSSQSRRKSRKTELEELREHVKELEGQLASLKAHKGEQGGILIHSKPIAGAAASSSAALWERTARTQKDQRVRAELENARLREVLEGQLKVAMSLEKLLRKRSSHEALGSSGSVAKRLAVFDPDQDAALFDALEAQLDELYEQLDAIWLETGLVVTQHEVDEAEAKLDVANNIYLEFISSKVVPFSAKRVSDAVWQLMSGGIKVTNGHISAVERSEDVIKNRFSLTLRLRRSEAQILVNMAVKRFVEDSGREVFAWACEGYTEGSSIGHQRVKISENGWAVIEKHRMTSPSLGLDEQCDDESCIMQTCVRMVPEFPGMEQQRAHAGLLLEMIIGSYTTNIRCLIQHIENMLLSGSRVPSDEIDCYI